MEMPTLVETTAKEGEIEQHPSFHLNKIRPFQGGIYLGFDRGGLLLTPKTRKKSRLKGLGKALLNISGLRNPATDQYLAIRDELAAKIKRDIPQKIRRLEEESLEDIARHVENIDTGITFEGNAPLRYTNAFRLQQKAKELVFDLDNYTQREVRFLKKDLAMIKAYFEKILPGDSIHALGMRLIEDHEDSLDEVVEKREREGEKVREIAGIAQDWIRKSVRSERSHKYFVQFGHLKQLFNTYQDLTRLAGGSIEGEGFLDLIKGELKDQINKDMERDADLFEMYDRFRTLLNIPNKDPGYGGSLIDDNNVIKTIQRNGKEYLNEFLPQAISAIRELFASEGDHISHAQKLATFMHWTTEYVDNFYEDEVVDFEKTNEAFKELLPAFNYAINEVSDDITLVDLTTRVLMQAGKIGNEDTEELVREGIASSVVPAYVQAIKNNLRGGEVQKLPHFGYMFEGWDEVSDAAIKGSSEITLSIDEAIEKFRNGGRIDINDVQAKSKRLLDFAESTLFEPMVEEARMFVTDTIVPFYEQDLRNKILSDLAHAEKNYRVEYDGLRLVDGFLTELHDKMGEDYDEQFIDGAKEMIYNTYDRAILQTNNTILESENFSEIILPGRKISLPDRTKAKIFNMLHAGVDELKNPRKNPVRAALRIENALCEAYRCGLAEKGAGERILTYIIQGIYTRLGNEQGGEPSDISQIHYEIDPLVRVADNAVKLLHEKGFKISGYENLKKKGLQPYHNILKKDLHGLDEMEENREAALKALDVEDLKSDQEYRDICSAYDNHLMALDLFEQRFLPELAA